MDKEEEEDEDEDAEEDEEEDEDEEDAEEDAEEYEDEDEERSPRFGRINRKVSHRKGKESRLRGGAERSKN